MFITIQNLSRFTPWRRGCFAAMNSDALTCVSSGGQIALFILER